MSIGRLSIKQERLKASIVVFAFILTTIFLYVISPFLFIMFTSIQIAIVFFAGLVEYIVLWHSADEEVMRFRLPPSYWLLIFFWFTQFSSQIFQILVGIRNLEFLWAPSFWIAWWSFTIAWLLGIMVVRQFYIICPPSKGRGTDDISTC